MPYRKKLLFALGSLVFAAAFFLATRTSASEPPKRILSLAPAATEILFDIGLGESVIAVTKYCTWPPEAREKPSVGDMMNVNMEVVVGLMPDLVVVSNMNEHLIAQLEALGCKTISVGQDDFEEICDSMIAVGEACGVAGGAKARVGELRASVRAITATVGGTSPSVLVVVGRDMSDSSLKNLYVAGTRSFYNDLLTEANARNALVSDVRYARLSREGLLRLDPDIVIELVGEHGSASPEASFIQGQWRGLDDLRASQNDIAVVRGDFAMRAGPRYPQILEAFIDAIHNGKRDIDERDYATSRDNHVDR